MSRNSVQRFCDNDMQQSKDLKRKEWISKIAKRFRPEPNDTPDA